MKALKTPPKGSLGKAERFPDQGAQMAGKPDEQSCHAANTRKTAQVRLRLPEQHAEQWLALPPGVREHAAAVVFGASIDGVDLHDLPTLASELREARLVMQNALQLSLVKGAVLDTCRINDALNRINKILGGHQP